jgi:multidrug efflux pump subunit AcrA (membrane-fusion protein)
MRTLKSLLFLLLLASVAYKANAYYQYRIAAQAVPPHVPTVKARSGPLSITLTGAGRLEPLEYRVVGVREVQSTLVSIVDDGQMVKAGQVVAQLDTANLVKDLRDRQAAYDTAMATVASTEADVLLNLNNAQTKTKKAGQDQQLLVTTNRAATDQAKAQLDYNASDFAMAEKVSQRTAGLAKDRLVPQQDAQRDDLTAQGKKVNVVGATKQLEVARQTEKIGDSQGQMLVEDAKFGEKAAAGKAQEQVTNAKFNAFQARRQLELTQSQIKWCTMQAPIAGLAVVRRQWDRSMGIDRPLHAGDQVFPSMALMQIIDTSRMIVLADVGEIDIGHVRPGQAALIYPRAAPGLSLHGRVKSVSEVAEAPRVWGSTNLPGKKVFRVVLTVLDSRPKLLRPEMTADFELVENQVTGGVKVPIEAVFPTQALGRSGVQAFRSTIPRQGHSHERLNARTPERPTTGVVYLRRDGRFWPRTVTLGARNDNDVLVTKGLKPGDMVADRLPPPSLIGPAALAKPHTPAGGLLGLLPRGLFG